MGLVEDESGDRFSLVYRNRETKDNMFLVANFHRVIMVAQMRSYVYIIDRIVKI